MQYATYYDSPLGKILLAADEIGLTGSWFEGQKYFANTFESEYKIGNLPVLDFAKHWLDIYFSGQNTDNIPFPRTHLYGTEFQIAVWHSIIKTPYGTTTTYGEIARKISNQKNSPRMLARAVGNAIAHNSISIIVPCHRVIGSNGKLTGYAGGIDKKEYLLNLEKNGHI